MTERWAERWGVRRAYAPGERVAVRAGMVAGTVLRRVSDRGGVPRYSVLTHDGLRIADVDGLREM